MHITYVPCTRFCSSTTIRGSNSTAMTFLHASSSFIVMLPVPGPISSTVSVDRSAAFATIAFTYTPASGVRVTARGKRGKPVIDTATQF